MPCGKRPLVKMWDKPRKIRVITPSRYEQNEDSVKVHWKKVVRDLELSYKDDQFWESQADTVRDLVGSTVYRRIAKIFNLPFETTKYTSVSEESLIVPSEELYGKGRSSVTLADHHYSTSELTLSGEEEENVGEEEDSEQWTASTLPGSKQISRKSMAVPSKSISKMISSKSFSIFRMSRQTVTKPSSARFEQPESSTDSYPASDDDVRMHVGSKSTKKQRRRRVFNPYYDMLYCNESETDMIKWKSKYKQKGFEVSASDEFSKKAEIMTKKISHEFFEWWVSLGNLEFKSEIRRPEDIEELFQVWFDEHASRGIKLDPKILPCVLESIADYMCMYKAACPRVLKRQIAYDIHAEISPAHTTAFNAALPHKMKHIPAKNNTKATWDSVVIPEDLRSMTYVFDDIQHLTSTKAFQTWLKQRPCLPIPPCLADTGAEKKQQLFVVPSDFIFRKASSTESNQELALPVSEFQLEMKEVLSKIMLN